MEYIDGLRFCDWLESCTNKNYLAIFLEGLFRQARALDSIGLDHGQLAGSGKNILVRNGMPVIIDFEKASRARKAHNVKVLEAFLFRRKNSKITKKILSLFGELPFNF